MLIGHELGPFLIERELGSGAMGAVYQALFRDTGQRVAIKIISIGQLANETAVARFEREAKILKQLKHPNIVRLIATGRYKKTPFFAMELVDGESLDRVLARRDSFSWQEVVELGRQLCSALQHAHSKGIIHRDLKPSNVMVLPDGTVKLTDFGIAKDMDVTALTGANSTVGTAAYMSPEQCRGEKTLSLKSDLYSMGVMFYELLTGRKPFQAESAVEMFLMHVNSPFERPSRLVLDIPIWLDTLVCQLLEKKPEHRPFDAAMVDRVLAEVEEKALAQRSAGVDAAVARRVDRPGVRTEAADREAARVLRGVPRRKKARKTGPLLEQPWVRAAGLAAGLFGLVVILYVMTRPPSADSLYAVAKKAVDENDVQRAIDATQHFLDANPNRNDKEAKDAKDWNKKFWTQKREQQLFNRFTSKLKLAPEDDGQKLSDDALKHENDGDRDAAGRLWAKMKGIYEDQDAPEPAVYAWVAKKKLGDLSEQLEARDRELTAIIDKKRQDQKPPREPATEAEFNYMQALHFQLFGDIPAARDRWERIRDECLMRSLEDRIWGVSSAIQLRRGKATAIGNSQRERDARIELLRERLVKVDAVRPNADPTTKRQAAAVCRDIISLYGRDPDADVAAFAKKAETRLRELTDSPTAGGG